MTYFHTSFQLCWSIIKHIFWVYNFSCICQIRKFYLIFKYSSSICWKFSISFQYLTDYNHFKMSLLKTAILVLPSSVSITYFSWFPVISNCLLIWLIILFDVIITFSWVQKKIEIIETRDNVIFFSLIAFGCASGS